MKELLRESRASLLVEKRHSWEQFIVAFEGERDHQKNIPQLQITSVQKKCVYAA